MTRIVPNVNHALWVCQAVAHADLARIFTVDNTTEEVDGPESHATLVPAISLEPGCCGAPLQHPYSEGWSVSNPSAVTVAIACLALTFVVPLAVPCNGQQTPERALSAICLKGL